MTQAPGILRTTDQHRRILVVDDEPSIVSAVRRELSAPPFIRYRYAIEGYTDPAAALERAREQPFDAVISDYLMPGMLGVDFLNAFSQLQPDCARLVLSGHTDLSGLIRMINETHIYRFIPKPWHDYYLRGSLAQALDYSHTIATHRQLAAQIRERGIHIPPLASGESNLVLLVERDSGSLASLAHCLSEQNELDQLFAAIRSEIARKPTPQFDPQTLEIRSTCSAREALHIAEATPCACIIADQAIGEGGGIRLLQSMAEQHPDCARILTSAQASLEDLVNAVDLAQVFAFIEKPCSEFEVKACVAQAIARRRLMQENYLLAELVRKSMRLGN